MTQIEKLTAFDFLLHLADYDKIELLRGNPYNINIRLADNEPILGNNPIVLGDGFLTWEQFDKYFSEFINGLDEIELNKYICKEN